MSTLPPIAETIAQGGRTGSVETTAAGFDIEFKIPTLSNSQGLTPEHLFGAAWAACFNGAVNYVVKESGYSETGEGITVTARVQLHPEGPQPFSVELLVKIPYLDESKARDVVQKAHTMCAYSKATKGNVEVKLTLV